ncbi:MULTISPECIES: restriction endonuclease fold toxin 5 domain-containing protein [Xenorhabdus]|uniref:restriction endonuclease fold toxin 5 domain-containing protein n=1 Tax=Xenorhabdus TaxID=626 RepID=UPI000689622E|nr:MULTISPECIES: restriction endonuclease fold toxin 5 domain-containing protein [Xenorhabdus]
MIFAIPPIAAALEWTIAGCAAILVGIGIMESTKGTTVDDIELEPAPVPKKPKTRTEEEIENDINIGKAKARYRIEEIEKEGSLSRSTEKCKSCPASTGIAKNESRNFGDPINLKYQVYITKAPFGPGWVQEWDYATVSFDGFQPPSCLLQETKGAYDQFFISEGVLKKFYSGVRGTVQQAHTQSFVVQSTPPNKLAWYFMERLSFMYFNKIFKGDGLIMDVYHVPMI